ncbi:FimD/PapC N-terminal domain-containing protein, partial [Serratia quinivorans]
RQSQTDLSVFEDAGGQPPGTYRVDILLNERLTETRMVTFSAGPDGLQPCLSVADLAGWGVRTALFPALGSADSRCANLAAIPQASAQLRFSQQQLLLSIPQAAMTPQPRGYVPSSQWDEGIPALILNYSLTGADTTARGSGQGGDSNSQFANL